MIRKVGDIISADLQPDNKWEIMTLINNVAVIKSLISNREVDVDFNEPFILLDPFEDGRRYCYDKKEIVPAPYGKDILTIYDLLEASKHYGLKDLI